MGDDRAGELRTVGINHVRDMKKNRQFVVIVILVGVMLACTLPVSPGQGTPRPADTETFTITEEPTLVLFATAISASVTNTEEPTQPPAPTATANVVTITASGGNLNIRRGPGAPYNPISVLTEGQTAIAVARNADGSWLNIDIPDGSGQGWVNATTQFSVSTGVINLLPVATLDLPVPAYIRNCTFHEMRIKPADIIVPIQTDPSSRLQLNPGYYDIIDIPTGKMVRSINLREGDWMDITKDGLGSIYACP